MSRRVGCVSRSRSVVIYGSFVLALGGWAVSAWAWWCFGVEAGVRPSFIMALSVAIAFTATLAVTVVMPEKARLYSLGYQDGVAQGLAMARDPEPTRLVAVK